MADVRNMQDKRSEAEQYLQKLMAYTEPVDQLNRDDLLAEIALNEDITKYCFRDGAMSRMTKPCIDQATSRLKSDAASFINEFFQMKSETKINLYKKMADAYLKAAEVYLGRQHDLGGYFTEISNIWEDFQGCFSLLPNWENLSFADKISNFFKKKQCETKPPEHTELDPTRYNHCWHDRQPDGKSRYVCPGGYIQE